MAGMRTNWTRILSKLDYANVNARPSGSQQGACADISEATCTARASRSLTTLLPAECEHVCLGQGASCAVSDTVCEAEITPGRHLQREFVVSLKTTTARSRIHLMCLLSQSVQFSSLELFWIRTGATDSPLDSSESHTNLAVI